MLLWVHLRFASSVCEIRYTVSTEEGLLFYVEHGWSRIPTFERGRSSDRLARNSLPSRFTLMTSMSSENSDKT